MALVALVLSLFVVALGAVGLAAPGRLLDIVRQFQAPAGLYVAAVLRVVFGLALLFAAPTSRAPEVIHVVGVVIVIAGIITPLFGRERIRKLLEWWSARGPMFVRAWAVVALGLGLFLAYSVSP